MRVEPFLEHCISRQKFNAAEEADAYLFFVNQGVRYIQDFYSQPFKPELITELFEGWECETKIEREPRFSNNDDVIVMLYCKSINRISYYTEHTSDQNIRLPLTLNDFLSDCFRNGIELKWKNYEGIARNTCNICICRVRIQVILMTII